MCEPGPQARTIVGMLSKAKVFFGIKIGIYDLAKISVNYQLFRRSDTETNWFKSGLVSVT